MRSSRLQSTRVRLSAPSVHCVNLDQIETIPTPEGFPALLCSLDSSDHEARRYSSRLASRGGAARLGDL